MKISVELSESELKAVCRMTGEKKKGPAIRKLVEIELMRLERSAFVDEVLSGKFTADLEDVRKARIRDRKESGKMAKALSK